MTIEKKLLLGRLLTRSGDHAWDFAVPLALLSLFPGRLQIAAVYYLLTKICLLILTPAVGRLLDRRPRHSIIRIGILLQLISVLTGGGMFWALASQTLDSIHGITAGLFAVLIAAGVGAAVGAMMIDICVGNDLVPTLVQAQRLTHFNSWLRRVDLASEVLSPIAAGVLLSIRPESNPMTGFFLVVAWNVLSFLPEFLLLKSVLADSLEDMSQIHSAAEESSARHFWQSLGHFNMGRVFREPLTLLLASYSLLWLSALSPHGFLLTGYLKDQVHMPEAEIGLFRGLGALFGLISTVTFPVLVKRLGLIRSSRWHLCFQALTVLAAAALFLLQSRVAMYGFLFFILCSRVGLYGFSNGEFELRQRLIAPSERGRVNGFGSGLNTLATLLLFVAGSLLPGTAYFSALVVVSATAVLCSLVLFHLWTGGRAAKSLDKC